MNAFFVINVINIVPFPINKYNVSIFMIFFLYIYNRKIYDLCWMSTYFV